MCVPSIVSQGSKNNFQLDTTAHTLFFGNVENDSPSSEDRPSETLAPEWNSYTPRPHFQGLDLDLAMKGRGGYEPGKTIDLLAGTGVESFTEVCF